MHFVDQVDLKSTTCGRILDIVQQIAGIVDLSLGRRIDFNQIDKSTFIDFSACRALPAGLGSNARIAIERLGENPCNGGLTHATGTGKQVGMVQALGLERICQRLEHMFLPHCFREIPGPPLSGKYKVTH